jgi:hypothetical protein
MTAAEHFKIVNDVYTKNRGGQMTTLELAEGLNGSVVDLQFFCSTRADGSVSLFSREPL